MNGLEGAYPKDFYLGCIKGCIWVAEDGESRYTGVYVEHIPKCPNYGKEEKELKVKVRNAHL